VSSKRPQLTPEEQEAADWEKARLWAESTPDWSEALWHKINAALGYKVTTHNKIKAREPSE
jgi:hypothetical protein